jgi:hypothetical protein
MNDAGKIIILSIILFFSLIFLTMRIETPFDGNDTLGFPFTFFIKYGGKSTHYHPYSTETYFGFLLVDLVVAGLLSFGLWKLYKKLKLRLK